MPEYSTLSRSDSRNKLEILGIDYIWSVVSPISQKSAQGDKFHNPNTGNIDQLPGNKEFEIITATGLLSRAHFIPLNELVESSKGLDGSLTATHQVGDVITILTGVKFMEFTYGDYDLTSNSVLEVTIGISYNGRRVQ